MSNMIFPTINLKNNAQSNLPSGNQIDLGEINVIKY